MFVLVSRTQAGPGRAVKQKQEEISRNHVQTFISPSVSVEQDVQESKKGSLYFIVSGLDISARKETESDARAN